MKSLIEENVIQIIAEKETGFLNDKLLMSFKDAINKYNDLVEKGYTKKRENNLLSITDSHLHRTELKSIENTNAQQGIFLCGSLDFSANFSKKSNYFLFNI